MYNLCLSSSRPSDSSCHSLILPYTGSSYKPTVSYDDLSRLSSVRHILRSLHFNINVLPTHMFNTTGITNMIDLRELNCESEVLSLQVAMRNSFMMTFFQCLLQHNDLWLPIIWYHRLPTTVARAGSIRIGDWWSRPWFTRSDEAPSPPGIKNLLVSKASVISGSL